MSIVVQVRKWLSNIIRIIWAGQGEKLAKRSTCYKLEEKGEIFENREGEG